MGNAEQQPGVYGYPVNYSYYLSNQSLMKLRRTWMCGISKNYSGFGYFDQKDYVTGENGNVKIRTTWTKVNVLFCLLLIGTTWIMFAS